MRVLLITAAGLSSRFARSLGYSCLKCIYYEKSFTESLLYRMIYRNPDFDRYIIVGGYRFYELRESVTQHFQKDLGRISLVENNRYADYGSGYSLYLGLQEALRLKADEIVFVEGDLFLDSDGFHQVCQSPLNVVTSNREPILAQSSVVFYYDLNGGIHYLYDTDHQVLQINEPFVSIFNSGQVWKLSKPELIEKLCGEMQSSDWHTTNLVFIQKYFQSLQKTEYQNIRFDHWINCNTVDDFRKSVKGAAYDFLA